jgi:N-acetylmuramoyl-L-alanine amidase
MAFRWHSGIIAVSLIILFGGIAAAGPLNLTVVYPKDGQRIPAVDSTFIFGSVDPGATLIINGEIIKVHKQGGWLAFLPVKPGAFAFSLTATKGGAIDTATVTVNLPDLRKYSYDNLYFRPGSFQPSDSVWVQPGDKIELSFSGTPYCNAYAVVAGDSVPMLEVPPQPYYHRRNVFQKDDESVEDIPDSLLIRGIYKGTFTVPDTVCEDLRVTYYLYPPSLAQIGWMLSYEDFTESKSLVYHLFGSLPSLKSMVRTIPIRVMDPAKDPVAELTDSMTVIRTGPKRGYLCIHQPAGIRAEVIGRDGDWLRLRLSDYQDGWVPVGAAEMLPAGTVVPHSFIRRIQTVKEPKCLSIRVATSARHPFRVVENFDEKSITVYIYGADADTDWIRYDNSDSVINQIVWFQPEPGLFAIKIYENENRIWGYDGYYVGNEFRFDLKKFPSTKRRISDLRFVIDPGHSPDPGAIGPTGLTEKETNLAIARQLAADLERKGADVILTRYGQDSLPLYDRPKIAVEEKADIFISIHNNALPDGTNPFINNGVSVYYYHPHSAALARSVHESLVRSLDLKDFDWYYGNLAVIRPTQYPAILVECAFMMIPEQEVRLRTKKFRRKISRAIIAGIEDFLRGRPLTEWDIDQRASYNWR